MKLDSIDTLLTEELRDVYDAEKQITKALPKMAKAARSPELKQALEEHLEVTKGQINRLEEIFGILDEKPKNRPCAGMRGIIKEGQEMMRVDKRNSNENLVDAAIISAAQRVEHYEIAVYGTLRTYAERMRNDRIAKLLEQTKQEEAEADRKLSSISGGLLSSAEQGLGEEGSEENAASTRRRSPSSARPAPDRSSGVKRRAR